MIENLSFKEAYSDIFLKTSIKILISKDKINQELAEMAKVTMAFWHYYQLETYAANNKNTLDLKCNLTWSIFYSTTPFKVNLVKKEQSLVVKLVWPYYSYNNKYINYYVNLHYHSFAYSLFFLPQGKNIPDDGKYAFLQIIEFKVI